MSIPNRNFGRTETTTTRLRSLTLALATSVLLLGGFGVASASAATERYMRYQGLSAGNAKASEAAHTGSLTSSGSADHSFCPSLARGYAGYTSSPNSSSNITVASSYCGYGYQGANWGSTGGNYWHGAVWNKNASTYDGFDYADFTW